MNVKFNARFNVQNLHISLKVSNFAHVKEGGRSLTNRPISTLYAFPSMDIFYCICLDSRGVEIPKAIIASCEDEAEYIASTMELQLVDFCEV